MWHEFKVVNTFYSNPDQQGNVKALKTRVCKISLDIDRIHYPEEIVSIDGKVKKGECSIKYMDEPMQLKHSYEEVRDLLKNHPPSNPVFVKGFKRYDKSTKNNK